MNNNEKTYVKRKRPQIGIKWKMFAILICFISLFALANWVFQVRMLNFFYQNAKFDELEDSEERISASLDNEGALSDVLNDCAGEYYSDIWVYDVSDGMLDTNRPLLYADGIGDSFGPFLEPNFENMYRSAENNGGSYIAVVPMKNFKESYFEFKIIADNYGDKGSYPFVSGNVREVNVMYLSIRETADGSFLIVQRSSIAPMGAMVRTLENQVLFMCVFLLILALVLAGIMSKLITKPIIQINESAKNLAAGRYNIEFEGRGYREIDELSDTLNYAANELSKNDNLQKELIANISHDLRTPLTMIKGYSEVMRDIPGENTPENVQVIIDEATRLTELVNDMFDLSRLQSGTRAPELRLFNITEAVRSTMYRYEKLTMQDGYKIEFIADRDVNVYADSGMILQVLYNLINNAINYSGKNKIIKVFQTLNGDTVRISIADNGDGIAEEDIPFIWDRYYKVDKVHRRATVGTGIGLSIVKGILELHNATYGVTSAPNVGSTFWFELKTSDSEEYKAEIVEL